ncbi:MAG: hypothetical protein A3J38_05115 [Gammaproteobacteria bacterium RIFCSPHIGHO2_12_FULL_45_9]|nr:MAG: hypothetical protein A3J38_05115 [Gammaproteobacteria bacterium RIFCSPHIGHO2_12_FULL_45_9]
MKSNKPFLLRALHEWIIANGCTPYLLVNATIEGTVVPEQYVNAEGRIILDLSPQAIANLHMENTAIRFSARFSGIRHELYLPISAILAIYAKENGAGMTFHAAEQNPWLETPVSQKPVAFRVVKNEANSEKE